MTTATEIAAYLDDLLETTSTPDYPPAHNGLQIDCRGPIRKIAAAVDYSTRTIANAVTADANFLIVHHGMFWGGAQNIVGPAYGRLRLLVEKDVAVYSSHLPLDRHDRFGNNVLLARELGLTPSGGFARFQTIDIGVRGETETDTADLIARAAKFAAAHGGTVRATPVPEKHRTRKWAMCTGGGASADTLREATENGIDTLIVGEGPHWTAVQAADEGLVIIYAGHYATETPGVSAIAAHVAEKFSLPSVFLPSPTGL